VAAAWLFVLGGYYAVATSLPVGASRSTFGDIFLCFLPLVVNGALLLNAATTDWRKNAFWMLLALGCSLWLGGQAFWTYVEVYQHRSVPDPFSGDIVFFLHTVPMIAALTMQPHKRPNSRKSLHDYVDFTVIVCWWVYLYLFVVIPWQYILVDDARYDKAYNIISIFENLVFVGGAAYLSMKANGHWRRTYAHLAGAGAMYIFGSLLVTSAIDRRVYSAGSLFELPLIASLLWLATAGITAYRSRDKGSGSTDEAPEDSAESPTQIEGAWASRMARTALLSLPIIALWCMKFSPVPMEVHLFRIVVTLGAIFPLGFLAFLRHELVDADRIRLLRASQESLDNLKRLQTQFVQSEKLASLGQLVAGAAHEINNPLTAILGYSELIADDVSGDSRSRNLAGKIREQARRTKVLVTNLLSFARQVPSGQRTALDVNTIVNSSAQFRRVDLRGKNIRIDLQTGTAIPEVRADANQLLQVFINIINNAVDAMEEVGGGTLTITTTFEKSKVVILFSDTGPGIRDPHLVFDPFYTTKPVGKGNGLGLSICYGLVHDQDGTISCSNRPEGGATFRIELPAVPAIYPQRAVSTTTQNLPEKIA
jgi:signal transduction histidine kinase